MSKYKFVEPADVRIVKGRKVKRIVALRDIPRHNVEKGDLGGFLEKESNLNQEGDCWVGGNAIVYMDAKVTGGALVDGEAQVYANASVDDWAQVREGAQVYDNAKLRERCLVMGNSRVHGDAKVWGSALVCERAVVSGYAAVAGRCGIYGHASLSGESLVEGSMLVKDRARVIGHAQLLGGGTVYGSALVGGDVYSRSWVYFGGSVVVNGKDYFISIEGGKRLQEKNVTVVKDYVSGKVFFCCEDGVYSYKEFKEKVKSEGDWSRAKRLVKAMRGQLGDWFLKGD